MQAMILVGGPGTRLQTVVPDLPKPMAPIRSRPFLEILLEYLGKQGFRDVVLCTGYLSQTVVNHFGEQYGTIRIRYSVEPEPLGTGGAIKLGLMSLNHDPVFVLNGDSFVQIDYQAMLEKHEKASAHMTMALKQVEDVSRYGKVTVEDGCVIAFQEKGEPGGGLINAGVYLLSKRVLDQYEFPTRFSFEEQFLRTAVKDLRPQAFITNGYFIDIGVPAEYQRAQLELFDRLAKM